MNSIKDAVSGKKTYFAVAIGLLYAFGCWVGFWKFDETILSAIGLSSVAFLRMAIAKATTSDQAADQPGPTSVNSLVNLFFLSGALAIGGAGCKHTLAPGTPESPSPYGGDTILFDAEQAITTGYDLLHIFVSWENRNRAALAFVPEIKKAADNVRAHGQEWVDSVTRLLESYRVSPTPENRNALADGLRVLRQAIAESTLYLTKYGPAHSS